MATNQYHRAQTTYKFGQGYTADGDALSRFGSKILPTSTTWSNDRLEDGRKAKRALQRRIKPRRKKFSDRISGPGPLFGLPRGVPKFPSGGDGLASISLRPSLVDRNLNPFRTGVVARPRRPATASTPSRSTGLRRGSGHHCSRSRSFSASPIAPGSRKTIALEDESVAHIENPKSTGSEDVSPHKYYTAMGSPEHISDEEPVTRTPRPPSGKKRGRYSQEDAIRRVIRPTKDATDAGSSEPHLDYQHCCAAVEDETPERGTPAEHIDVHSQLLEHPRPNEEDGAVDGPSLEEDRAAKVMLSSTVLLSPRGRSRTTRLTCRPQPMGWDAERAPVEETPADRDTHPGRPWERYGGQNLRYDRPVAALSPRGVEPLVTTNGDEIDRLVTSKEYMGLVASFWRSGSIPRTSDGDAVGTVKSMIFGTDESAGDREIAVFVAAALVAPLAVAPAKATSSTVKQHETARRSERKGPKTVLTKGVTLRAVPLHVGDSSQRYNPYHLRVVRRQMDGDLESLDTLDNCYSGRDGSVSDRNEAGRVHNRFGGTHPEDINEKNRACGFESGDSTMTEYDRGQTGVEVAAFRDSGVVYVNVHGETSFQSLEDWRREKERYGKISQMSFCRSYPIWKYFLAFKAFVRTRRLDELRRQLEEGLVVLDPVCRPAMAEVVSQLQRLSSLQFVTAKKGTTALYTLGEFFEEQIRNTVGCSRLVREVYDTCGQILGRMAKRNLGAKGVLAVSEARSQVSPKRDVGSLDNNASSVHENLSLEEVLLAKPTLGSEAFAPKRSGPTTSVANQAIEAKPSSNFWWLTACRRAECGRIARACRWSRQRMRQELRGIVLEHNEQLLASVSRAVPAATDCGRDSIQAWNEEGARIRKNEVGNPVGDVASRSQQWNSIGTIRNISRWRYEARPCPVGESRTALPIDEESLTQVSSLALEASLTERAGVDEEDVREWREAFRRRVNMTGGIRRPKNFLARSRFRSRLSLPDSCLSVPQAIHLACELVPHAVETLAFANPLGAKSAITDIFQSELTPNLCGEGFFPVTHRFHGEHRGMTEDTFVLATIRLSAQCLGGIDSQLSEVSFDNASFGQGAGNKDTVESSIRGWDEGHRGKPIRPAAGRLLRDTTGENLPASVVDVRLWEENAAADTSPLKNSTARVKPAGTAHGGIIAGARGILVEARRSEAHRTEIPSQESKEPTTLGGKNIHPCSRIAFEVVLEGRFDERDIQVAPSLQEFLSIARFLQLGVLGILAGLPCLLEHPEVEPFIRMSEELGFGLDLSGGGQYAEETFPESEMGGFGTAKGGNTAFDVAVKIVEYTLSRGIGGVTEETEKVREQILSRSDWLKNLTEDPYFKALQDQIVMSLASSHNAVYRIVDGFQPLLDEYEELRKFALERDARKLSFQNSPDPDEFAKELVATRNRHGEAKLDLSLAFLAKENIEWLRVWYSRFDGYRRRILSKTTRCPQVLLSVKTKSLVTYLMALPDACVREIRQMGPVFLVDFTLRLGAVLRRCNAVLCGGLGGVDAIGEKAGFVGAIRHWLWRLTEEVNYVDKLVMFLEEIGCFDSNPHPTTASDRVRQEFPSKRPASSILPQDGSVSCPLEQVREQPCCVDKRDAAGYSPGGSNPSTAEGIASRAAGDSMGCGGNIMEKRSSFGKITSPQMQEAIEGLRFHLVALQRAVDQANVDLLVASREFATLLMKELSSLGQDIARLEADVTAPVFCDAATDPTKACAQLAAFQPRLVELQDKEKKYRRYNILLDRDLRDGAVTKGGAKRRQDDEKLRLDLERVAFQRKKLVLTWEAQRNALDIRREWEESTLIACDPAEMARRHAQAVRAHAIAANANGSMDSVAISCRKTLEYLGKIVDAVASLWNRNLTAAYWERIERLMPLGEDRKEAGRSKYMAELRSAAGLEPSILPAGAYPMDSCGEGKSGKLISPPSSPGEVANVKAHCEGLQAEENACSGMPSGGRDGYTAEVVIDRPTVEGQYHTHSRVPAVANNCGKTATEAKGHSAVPSSSASEKAVNSEVRDRNAVAKVSSVWADAISTDKGLDQQEKTLSLSRTSLDVMNALTSGKPKADTKGKGVGEEHVKRGMRSRMMSSVGRLRRERARQRAEIHGVFPMAAEWGGLTLAALLKHGLLERKSKICAISEEATASAVLRKTLEELEDTWEAAPMLFDWHFDEGPPAPGQSKQPPNLGDEALHRRQLYAKVLAEPALKSSIYSVGSMCGGAYGTEDRDLTSEGFTSLLSNGDELLRLSEHCRVVVDNMVDAPQPLLASGGVGTDAREWQDKISWFQELITHWMATQEQWVRLAPAFIPEDLAGSIPTNERARFTEISGVFQGILGTFRAEKHLKTLAASQGVEKGGRSLLARVCKLRDNLEGVSLTMNKWLGSCAAACPRLLALPSHQIYRLFRDWAAGRVGSGSAAGETNERVACMFRGVGEIVWEKIMTTSGSNVKIRMAAAGVRSSGAGHEVVFFSHPVPAIGRFEHWVREIDRQLISAVARDVEVVLNALDKHENVGPGSPHLLHVEFEGEAIPSDVVEDTDNGGGPPANGKKGAPTSGSRPTLQGSLLAREAYWTAAVETALAGSTPRSLASVRGSRGAMSKNSEDWLGILHASLLRYVDGWARELREPGTGAYSSVVNGALITQALHQRDVVDGLLEGLYPPPQLGKGDVDEGSLPSTSTPSLCGGGQRGGDTKINPKSGSFPFVWTCHLRHYSASRAEALTQQRSYLRNGGDGDEGSEGDESAIAPAPPPLMKIGIGPWNVPYGFEYAGTMERLWLTPLSERCLLHAVHSAKGCLGGLLVPGSGSSGNSQHCGSRGALRASSSFEGNDAFGVSTAAQDLSVAFGRAFRVLHCSCATSPQAVSNVITSTLTSGAVSLFAGVDALPKISLAVLAESLRAIMLCLHAGQESVIVNGEEVTFTTKPYQLPNYDPLLHQWKLLPWGAAPGSGGGPFVGIFASLANHGPDPALPLSLRASFRPVLVAPPNPPLLFEAMLFTSGFLGARELVHGVVQGLYELRQRDLLGESQGPSGSTHATSGAHTSGDHEKEPFELLDATTILHRIAVRAVRNATELLVPETARELRAARRKLGLASLTTSERKAKTDILSRAVEARVLIAGVVRALLREEIASQAKRSLAPDGGSDLTQQTHLVGSNLDAALRASRAVSEQRSATEPLSSGGDDRTQETSARRAAMVSTFEESAHLRKILKPLVELESAGRKLAQRNAKTRANELAEARTASRSHDVMEFRAMLKRAFIVNGMSPTKDQINAAVEVWDSLWSCRTPAVIVTGAAGVGKSAIFHAMPRMAEYVNTINRKLNKYLRKITAAKDKQQATASRGKGSVPGEKTEAQASNSVTVDPPGAVLEPPMNARGAAPYRRIVNRQVNFVQYVNTTATFRRKARTAGGDGGTVASGASGSSKGTKATAASELSNISWGSSQGGASVFSQRSYGSKSTTATGLSKGASGAKWSTSSAVPPGTLEGSAFVVPAQEVEVLYTGGCSTEHLIGSTDERGSWLDGHLLRRLRVLVEGARGTAKRAVTGRHRARGVGTGDVCPRPSGNATSGFSHGCKSRLLVLDGPVSKMLEGILAGDPASGSSLTGLEEHGHNSRCLLLPNGEALALDAWGHIAVEAGEVRHLSPSTLTVVTVVHLRSDGRALIKGLLEAWCKKQSRRKFQQRGATRSLNPVVVKTLTDFFNQEGFVQGACCLMATGDTTRAVESTEASISPSIAASRMRNTLILLEGLLDQLIEVDDNSVEWEQENKTAANQNKLVADSIIRVSTTATLSRLGDKSEGQQEAPSSTPADVQDNDVSGASSVESTTASIQKTTGETLEEPRARKAEVTLAEAQEITHRLRLRTILLCVYASVWGMGGHLVGDACQKHCSDYIRQFAPIDLRQHIREHNLFGCAVDIRQAKLIPVGNDASTCPNVLPRGVWTMDPPWAMQASELSTPLPPSLIIPSARVSSVATAVHTLLRLHGARILVEGPSGAGKTALLSHLLRTLGKGVPDIVTEAACDGSDATELRGGCEAPFTFGGERVKGEAVQVCQVEQKQQNASSGKGRSELNPLLLGEVGADAKKSGSEEEDGGDETDIGARIRILDYARRMMVDAGSAAITASSEADSTSESPRGLRRSMFIADKERNGLSPSIRPSHRRAFPWSSTVYLSMRRRGATEDVARVIGGALRREKDGVLEGPLASEVVIFLDDVHLTQEMAGDGHADDPCKANCCAAEALREMMDKYTPVGEIGGNTNASRITSGSDDGDFKVSGKSGSTEEVGLTRLGQVPPDFIPPAPAGPGGDSYSRPSSASILAARTTFPTVASISPSSTASMALRATRRMSVGGRGSGRPSTIPGNFITQQQQNAFHPSVVSSNARLWRRFFILALDAPSTAEMRTIFVRACSDAFGGDGPVSSALGGPRSNTTLLANEVWTAVDALGEIATEFLHLLQLRLRGISTERGTARYPSVGIHSSRTNWMDCEGSRTAAALAVVRFDFFALGRLLRPLVIARRGGVSTPAAVLRLWCHEIMREVVEPLPEIWQRDLAASELAKLIRERASDVGVPADEEKHLVRCLLEGGESSTIWTNTRGLVMAIAYREQQAAKAMGSKNGYASNTLETSRPVRETPCTTHMDDEVSYREVCAVGMGHNRGHGGTARVMVAHGVLLKTEEVFSPDAMAEHLTAAINVLRVPWPARPDSQPMVTAEDVTNVCKCLRHLSLPRNPVVVIRTNCRGMSREGGPVSAFRLACALERARLVVMDGGAGRMCAKLEGAQGAAHTPAASSFSFRAVFRDAVLSCLGRGPRGPYLEEGKVGKGLRLKRGDADRDVARGTWPDPTARTPGTSRGVAHSPNDPGRPLLGTKTVLLIQGASSLWDAGMGDWALRALMDLVDGGEVRSLFSDSELLELAAEEEQHDLRRQNCCASEGWAAVRSDSRFGFRGGVDSTDDKCGNMRFSHEMPWWSCSTHSGADFIYRGIVHRVRRSLTVALCLTDDEMGAVSPSFPTLSTCSCMRLETRSARSMRTEAARSLKSYRTSSTSQTPSTQTPVVMSGSSGVRAASDASCGGVRLWPCATHVNLVGLLAFERFQSTVSAVKDVAPLDPGADAFERDAAVALQDAHRLFDAWMVTVEPACVQVFCAVEACFGFGRDEDKAGGVEGSSPGKRWKSLKARCLRAVAEEGRGPRGASLGEVLMLFKHICRLGCHRIVRRVQTLRRALRAAEDWGVAESRRIVEKLELKRRRQDTMQALADNGEQVRRLQEEKIRVQKYWNEQSNKPREQREAQGIRMQQVAIALQPLRAENEASKEALTTLADDEMEFLCTLCLGPIGTSTTGEISEHIAAATRQRKNGLHPELPFVVETVAVMLGNMSGYPWRSGEWVRLKASPSIKIIRSLLLDPSIGERLTSFNPESQAGKKTVKIVLDKMAQRQAEKSAGASGEDGTSSPLVSSKMSNSGISGMELDSPAVVFAKSMPVMPLKLESRACGLLAAWVRDTVIAVEGMQRAAEIREAIHEEAKATRQEEERVRAGVLDEIKPLDEMLSLRATHKSRLSKRLRHIQHRQSLLNELAIMRGTVEDSLEVCRQELEDLVEVARLFPGDALCFAALTCLTAHLPYNLRSVALRRAREAARNMGVPVSDCENEPDGTDTGSGSMGSGGTMPQALDLKRFRLGHYAAGVLTNSMQLQGWVQPPNFEDGEDSEDDTEGRGTSDDTRGRNASPLPFHPAFIDAAMLTLSTPKWPLIIDPEGVALKWLRQVYPEQKRLSAVIPASIVNMEIISGCAANGELLPVCYTEGGLHLDFAFFLGSDVLPGEDVRWCEENVEVDGYVTVGHGPDAMTIGLKPGFRIILFTTSLEFSSVRVVSPALPAGPRARGISSNNNNSHLVFLEDSPSALAGIQLIRFGGVDRLGIEVNSEHEALTVDEGDSGLRSERQDSSSTCEELVDDGTPAVPSLILACMGLHHRLGLETLETLARRMCKDITGAFPLAMKRSEVDDALAAVVTARKESLAFSHQLSADHEAVIALLSGRPPCFHPTTPSSTSDVPVLLDGEPRTGVSDDVEGKQNRILNNLIETLFAYQSTLNKGLVNVPTCDRAAQEAKAEAAQTAERAARRLTQSGLRFLSRANDILHASGLDTMLYSPIFPGVLRVISDSLCGVSTDASSEQETDKERIILGALSQGLVARLPRDFVWTLPLAALASKTHDYFPARGWWDACMILLADRHGLEPRTPNQATLKNLVDLLAERPDRTSNPKESGDAQVKRETASGESDVKPELGDMTGGTEQVQAVVGPWLLKRETATAKSLGKISEGDVASNSDSDADGNNSSHKRTAILPQRWDLGFDTSEWTGRRGRSVRGADGIISGEKNAEVDSFCERFSRRWAAVKAERFKLNPIQAVAAGPFSKDDVLRRLVLLEVTMNDVFALLSRHVLNEAGLWSQWIAEIRGSLNSLGENYGCTGGDLIEQLRFLLAHPPPLFGSDSTPENLHASDGSASCSLSCSDGSSQSESSSSEESGGDSLDQDRSSPTSLDHKPRADSKRVNSTGTDIGTSDASQSSADAASDRRTPSDSEVLSGSPRVRRDSRERIKLKLGSVDGPEGKMVREKNKVQVSNEARKEFAVKASVLFGVCSNRKTAGTDAGSTQGVTVQTAGEKGERLEPRAIATPPSPMVPNDREDYIDDDDDYVTFVAERFRPRRDDSDWHREERSTPTLPLPRTVRKRTAENLRVSAGNGPSSGLAQAVIDPTGRTKAIASLSQNECPSDRRTLGATKGKAGNQKHKKGKRKKGRKGFDNEVKSVVDLSKRLSEPISQSLSLKARIPSQNESAQQNPSKSRYSLGYGDRRVGVTDITLSAISLKHVLKQQRCTASAIEIKEGELGSWSQRWNDSQLIGLVLLLALAPDGHLANKCAATCLVSGSKDDLDRSSLWRDMNEGCAMADLRRGGLHSALTNFCPGIPTVIMAPRNGDLSDTLSGHFMSLLSHIERIAGASGARVIYHDASKSVNVRLAGGALGAQTRKNWLEQSKTRGGQGLVEADGEPAKMNVSQTAWEICLEAASEGGWVVIADFDGIADHVSLILDGLSSQSAVRSGAAGAAGAVAEGNRKGQRGHAVINVVTAGSHGGQNSAIGDSHRNQGRSVTTARRFPAKESGAGSSTFDKTPTLPHPPDNPLFRNLSGEGGVISVRSQGVLVAARRPFPMPHKNFRVIFLSTSPVHGARDDHRSLVKGEGSIFWWYPVPAIPATGHGRSELKGRLQPSLAEECRVEIVQELRSRYVVGARTLREKEPVLDMISRGLASFVERKGCGGQVSDHGAVINMHLAAYLALEQVSPSPGTKIRCVGAGHTSPLRADAGICCENSHLPEPAFPQPDALGSVVAAPSTTPCGKEETFGRVVCGAIHKSVMATEISNVPIVDQTVGLLDAQAMQVRQEKLASVVSSVTKKSAGAIQ